jgi:hypothetical protein
VKCYRRSELWDFQLYQQAEQAIFQSLDLQLAVADIYEGVFAG